MKISDLPNIPPKTREEERKCWDKESDAKRSLEFAERSLDKALEKREAAANECLKDSPNRVAFRKLYSEYRTLLKEVSDKHKDVIEAATILTSSGFDGNRTGLEEIYKDMKLKEAALDRRNETCQKIYKIINKLCALDMRFNSANASVIRLQQNRSKLASKYFFAIYEVNISSYIEAKIYFEDLHKTAKVKSKTPLNDIINKHFRELDLSRSRIFLEDILSRDENGNKTGNFELSLPSVDVFFAAPIICFEAFRILVRAVQDREFLLAMETEGLAINALKYMAPEVTPTFPIYTTPQAHRKISDSVVSDASSATPPDEHSPRTYGYPQINPLHLAEALSAAANSNTASTPKATTTLQHTIATPSVASVSSVMVASSGPLRSVPEVSTKCCFFF